MVSLIMLIVNLINPKRIVQVRRMPAAKALRAHLLGLTLGFVLVSTNIAFAFDEASVVANILMLLWFALTTYFRGLFLLISLISLLVLGMLSVLIPAVSSTFLNHLLWYFTGYLCGGVLATVYNDLVFLFIMFGEKKRTKIAFAYDTGKKLNIIKSPKPEEEHAFLELIEQDGSIADRKLYDYQVEPPPDFPYTIAFVANPKILKRDGKRTTPDDYEEDPIIKNRDLFLRAVDNALASFELDQVLGRPEIWSRVRIITLFDDSVMNQNGDQVGMLQETQEDIYSSDSLDEPIENNLLDPMKQMNTNFQGLFEKAKAEDGHIDHLNVEEVDVIFAISASTSHDRSTAHFTDWVEGPEDEKEPDIILPPVPAEQYAPFTFDVDPCLRKNYDKDGNEITPPNIIFPKLEFSSGDDYQPIHEFWARCPGRVALNILGARQKTYIHEFAHAMASAFHGKIVDEYADYFVLGEAPEEVEDPEPSFYVNRIDRSRVKAGNGELIPVHKEFTQYNCTRYDSDLAHPSSEESWSGYFPKRINETIPCTMDRTFGAYRFDELLSTFIYDRLMAKLSRKGLPGKTEKARRGVAEEHIAA